jgi:hypothetical protein
VRVTERAHGVDSVVHSSAGASRHIVLRVQSNGPRFTSRTRRSGQRCLSVAVARPPLPVLLPTKAPRLMTSHSLSIHEPSHWRLARLVPYQCPRPRRCSRAMGWYHGGHRTRVRPSSWYSTSLLTVLIRDTPREVLIVDSAGPGAGHLVRPQPVAASPGACWTSGQSIPYQHMAL